MPDWLMSKVPGAAHLLDSGLTLEAIAAILVEDGLTTSAIEGERLDLDAVRSSVARHLGLPTVGLGEAACIVQLELPTAARAAGIRKDACHIASSTTARDNHLPR